MSVETTVLGNYPVLDDGIRAASPGGHDLDAARRNTVFLVYQGVRAPIDVTDPVLMSALHLNGSKMREVSSGLLNSIPLVDPIVAVSMPGAGEGSDYSGSTLSGGFDSEDI